MAEHKPLLDEAVRTRNFELAKLAKITAEAIKIRQEVERKAWGIVDRGLPENTQTGGVLVVPASLTDNSWTEAARMATEKKRQAANESA